MKQPIRDGFLLVWRHQRLVWWIFLVNLLLGFLASLAVRAALHPVLDQSLYAQRLSRQFDLAVYLELMMKPEVSPSPAFAGSAVAGFIFLIYMMFVSGGVLSVYRDDRKLSRSQFFECCGDYFWRFLRLMLCALIPFALVFVAVARVQSVAGRMARDAGPERQGFWFRIAGLSLCLLLALFVRAWFDLAQARTVVERVRGMFFLTWRSLVLALRNLPGLLARYLVLTLVTAIAAVVLGFAWLHTAHGSFLLSWLALETFTLVLVGVRLWQRASTLLWYENYLESHAPPVAAPLPVPQPQILVVEPLPPSLGEPSGS